MPDSAAIDSALIGKLLGDATLMAITTDGVYSNIAAPGKTRFVIVSLLSSEDEPMFNARAFEVGTYLVKAVIRSTSGADANTAAARIDTLLDGGTMTPTGYTLMNMERTERIRYNEVDPDDADARWQHRGGLYEIAVSA